MATFGNLDQSGSSGSSVQYDSYWSCFHNMPSGGNITSLTARIRKFLSGSSRMFIYSDDAGYPKDLLVTSAKVSRAGGFETVVNVHAVTPAVFLPAGNYWIACCSNTAGTSQQLCYAPSTGGVGKKVPATNQYLSPEAVAQAGGPNSTLLFQVYATYDVVATGLPVGYLKKGLVSGFHCFMSGYLIAKNMGVDPLKLPDGTPF